MAGLWGGVSGRYSRGCHQVSCTVLGLSSAPSWSLSQVQIQHQACFRDRLVRSLSIFKKPKAAPHCSHLFPMSVFRAGALRSRDQICMPHLNTLLHNPLRPPSCSPLPMLIRSPDEPPGCLTVSRVFLDQLPEHRVFGPSRQRARPPPHRLQAPQ